MKLRRMKAKDFRTDRRRAFLLADLLTAILLFSLAALFLFFPIKGYARIFYEERDRFAAEQRAASAVSKIRFAALYSGLGMRNGEEYKNAFFPNSGQPFTWSGPAAVSKGLLMPEASELRLAYAFPAGARAAMDAVAQAGRVEVTLSQEPAADYFEINTKATKGWVLFSHSGTGRPLYITAKRGRRLTLGSREESAFQISRGDRLYLFRAAKFYAVSGIMYMKDFRTTGDQPVENGIEDLRFKIEDNLLHIFILARGEDLKLKSNEGLQDEMDNWPKEFVPRKTSTACRLYSFHETLRLPNLRD